MTPSERPGSPSSLKLELLPDLGELDRISAALRVLLSRCEIAEEDAHLVDLALTEAFSNVVEHALPQSERDPLISLELALDDGVFRCRLVDNGGPFEEPDPKWPDEHSESGRGVAVIAEVMDRAEFTREGVRNILWMEKSLF